MVQEIRRAFADRLRQVEWLTEETRTRALAKLEAMGPKIGYPERWREHDSLEVVPGNVIGNLKRCRRFEFLYQVRRIGHSTQPDDWPVPPQTFSMSYRPQRNEIICPAAVLQPPFFDASADDAVNYGGLGAGIAHEITHGFDDQGRKFNGDGNLDDWWSGQDAVEFERRARIMVEQYNAYAIDEGPVDGQLTLGENIADLGGLRIAFRALAHRLAGTDPPPVDGLTWKQRFFLSYAQTWKEKARPEERRLRLSIDPHAPGEWRVNGAVVNMPEFWEAFGGVSPVRAPSDQDIW